MLVAALPLFPLQLPLIWSFKFRKIEDFLNISHVVKGKGPVKKNPTCTIKFFCLGNPHDGRPLPSLAARTALSSAELANSAAMFAQSCRETEPKEPNAERGW